MSAPFHYLLTLLSINGQTLPAYQKFCARNIYIRTLSENTSMLAFLGSILVLHYGANKDVYPYFAFDKFKMPPEGTNPEDGGWEGRGEDYDFGRTFYASLVTWAVRSLRVGSFDAWSGLAGKSMSRARQNMIYACGLNFYPLVSLSWCTSYRTCCFLLCA